MHILASWFRAAFGASIPILADIPDIIIEDAFDAALIDLQNDIPIIFGAETIDERQMLELTGLAESLTYEINKPPLISINTFEFRYNNRVLTSDDLIDNIDYTVDGRIAILPDTIDILGNWINRTFFMAPKDHIPLGLHINYESGMNLDYDMVSYDPTAVAPLTIITPVPTSEQKSIINAISKRALIDNLLLWATDPGISSKTISMDGVSQSNSGGIAGFEQYVRMLREQEQKFMSSLRRKYGFDMICKVL